jgi:hypothetical protein
MNKLTKHGTPMQRTHSRMMPWTLPLLPLLSPLRVKPKRVKPRRVKPRRKYLLNPRSPLPKIWLSLWLKKKPRESRRSTLAALLVIKASLANLWLYLKQLLLSLKPRAVLRLLLHARPSLLMNFPLPLSAHSDRMMKTALAVTSTIVAAVNSVDVTEAWAAAVVNTVDVVAAGMVDMASPKPLTSKTKLPSPNH